MEQEVLEILLTEKSEMTILQLSELCNVRTFQASKYIDMYQKLNNSIQVLVGVDTTNCKKNRDNILKRLVNGEYSTNEAKASDFKNEVIRCLQCDDINQSIIEISKLCNIAEGDAAVFVEKFKNIKYNETMLSSIETEEAVAARWDIINLLSRTFRPDRPF